MIMGYNDSPPLYLGLDGSLSPSRFRVSLFPGKHLDQTGRIAGNRSAKREVSQTCSFPDIETGRVSVVGRCKDREVSNSIL